VSVDFRAELFVGAVIVTGRDRQAFTPWGKPFTRARGHQTDELLFLHSSNVSVSREEMFPFRN